MSDLNLNAALALHAESAPAQALLSPLLRLLHHVLSRNLIFTQKTLWGIGRFFVGICHCIGWFWYPCKERCNCCADRQKHGIGASKQPHERTSYSTF